MHTILTPPGWPRPKGYNNGISATGETIFIAGQIGWNSNCEFESDDFVEQFNENDNNEN